MSENRGNPKRIDTLIINDDAETPSLLDPTTGQLMITNAVGQRIIELADGDKSVEGIADAILEEFVGGERDTVVAHTRDFLAIATEKGLVTWNP